YEDRPGAPDRVFATVDNPTYEHLVASWARVLRQAGAATADILHLHHLTPLNEAAARVAPDVPVVGHLMGPNSCCSRRSHPSLRCTGSTPRFGPNACVAGRALASCLWCHRLPNSRALRSS